MKKQKLLEFIKKYSLNGSIERCRWISNVTDKTLKVSVQSDDSNLLSSVIMSNWEGFGDAEIGITDTKGLKSQISALYDDEITINLISAEDDINKIIRMDLKDNKQINCFIASELDVCPKVVTMKKSMEYDAVINFDKETTERFLKSKASLSEVNNFTILMNKNKKLELVIGYSEINSRRTILDVTTLEGKDSVVDKLHFNANYLKEILSVNSDCDNTTLSVSNSGLIYVNFKSDEFNCQYYLTQIDI